MTPIDGISVAIVSWNRADLLASCLEAVRQALGNLGGEVIVVDNGSEDGSAAMVQERFPEVRLIENAANLGFAKAANQGLRQARGRCLLLLNSDAVVSREALCAMMDYLNKEPTIGAVGPRLLNSDGSFQPSVRWYPSLFTALLEPFESAIMGRWASLGDRRTRLVPALSGACLLVRRQAMEDVGLLDEDFFFYGEDVDWCFRMRQRGWKVVHLSDVHVVHIGGGSTGGPAWAYKVPLALARLRFCRKHRSRPHYWAYRFLTAVVFLLRALRWSLSAVTNTEDRAKARWYLSFGKRLILGAHPAWVVQSNER